MKSRVGPTKPDHPLPGLYISADSSEGGIIVLIVNKEDMATVIHSDHINYDVGDYIEQTDMKFVLYRGEVILSN